MIFGAERDRGPRPQYVVKQQQLGGVGGDIFEVGGGLVDVFLAVLIDDTYQLRAEVTRFG
jgi:hypothetical protein